MLCVFVSSFFASWNFGGVLTCALRKAASLPKGSSVLCVLPDTGERYLSTPLFDDVPADMTAEEQALFDAAPPTSAFPQPLPAPTDAGRALVAEFVAAFDRFVSVIEEQRARREIPDETDDRTDHH